MMTSEELPVRLCIASDWLYGVCVHLISCRLGCCLQSCIGRSRIRANMLVALFCLLGWASMSVIPAEGMASCQLPLNSIDQFVKSIMSCAQIPGLTLSVVRLSPSGTCPSLLTRSYGVIDVDSRTPVAVDTRFCIGSVTKTFTAALLAQRLKRHETFSMDSPVRAILGKDFQMSDEERTQKTTPRDILAHRVGIAKYYGAFLMGYNLTRQQIVARLKYIPEFRPFRQSRVFNNFLYVLAGYMSERLDDGWWETQLTKTFLKPLRMDKTTFADRVADWSSGFALPHALQDGKVVPLRAKVTGNILRPVGPAGSICTTAEDMAQWMLMLLSNGTTNSAEQLLDEDVVQDLFGNHNVFVEPMGLTLEKFPVESLALGYGLGWVAGKYRDRRRVFHSGFSNYYYSMVSLMPDDGIGVFAAINGPHLIRCDNAIKALHYFLTDIALEEEPWLNASTACLYPKLWTSKQKHDVTVLGSPVTEDSSATSSPSPAPDDPMSSTFTGNEYSTSFSTHEDFDTSTITNFYMMDEAEIITTTMQSLDPFTQVDVKPLRPEFKRRRRPQWMLSNRRRKTTTPAFPTKPSPSEIPSGPTPTSVYSTHGVEKQTVSEFDYYSASLANAKVSAVSPKLPFGSRIRMKNRILRRRPKRQSPNAIYSIESKLIGIYNNPFYGDVGVFVNRSSNRLMLSYGYYGVCHLDPLGQYENSFQMHFSNSIWYQSESDDMKLFAKHGMLDVHFGIAKYIALADRMVINLFDTESPPVFTRTHKTIESTTPNLARHLLPKFT